MTVSGFKACDYFACLSSNDLFGLTNDLYENVMRLLFGSEKVRESPDDERREWERSDFAWRAREFANFFFAFLEK